VRAPPCGQVPGVVVTPAGGIIVTWSLARPSERRWNCWGGLADGQEPAYRVTHRRVCARFGVRECRIRWDRRGAAGQSIVAGPSIANRVGAPVADRDRSAIADPSSNSNAARRPCACQDSRGRHIRGLPDRGRAVPDPFDEPTAQTRATQIGALVGLDAPSGVFLSGNQTVDPSADPTWVAVWTSEPGQSCPAPTCIDGFPVDPAIAVIQLEMDAYGTVLSFSRVLGPTQPRPAHLITEAQARKAAGGKPSTAELVWTLQPPGSQTFRLAWQLQYGSVQPSAEASRCMTLLDAGTGAQLFVGCTS
jgi:hypothetical protein